MSQTDQRDQAAPARPRLPFLAVAVTAVLLLFGVPWWLLVLGGQDWPGAVVAVGTVVFAAGAVALPLLMVAGHAKGSDAASLAGDVLLGVIWVLFTWSIVGGVVSLVLSLAGVGNPTRAVALGVVVVAAVLLAYGHFEAMRVPRVRTTEIRLPRLGAGLDGLRVVLLADTHYGPIDRAKWSERTVAAVNALEPDVVAHAGDIADGRVAQRRPQSRHLGDVRAALARVYVTGNHEYFSQAQEWLDHMSELGWEALHNRHVVVERGGSRLVVAGIDDRTAPSSGLPGHRPDIEHALDGADPDLPVLLLAHQPKQITTAVEAGVDLQVSGHTHGGQIWPFHLLVRVDQPWLQGLTALNDRTHLYTTRGAGFWGPPFRVFAPSEISLLVLRSA
ncbi:metallophosphoesterase [Actinokineospora bangkokensis]|uniref:Metallophosphoesterase n=1 Tax=Actinokineospora bangkokensis TaxID=1193682 RepID=A0A1Q9LRB8_9PSEU|nr:metallophosphoesterase [Actinokineospora bangkokensis]OLR94553.1 metallophosphoesterase [Actinokineospora bangkokensis]